MLQALLDDLAQLQNVDVTLLLDKRYQLQIDIPHGINVFFMLPQKSFIMQLSELLTDHDAVWPIAPESDAVLFDISRMAEQQQCQLFNSSSAAVAICADKFKTNQLLAQQGIAVVETIALSDFNHQFTAPWVLKPKASEGCEQSFLINSEQQLSEIQSQLDSLNNFIIQPFVEGDSLSLSCLFYQGTALLISCNRQILQIQQQQISLQACEVNIAKDDLQPYRNMLESVAENISGLSGYVGIDIIQPRFAEPLLLEINPRLTTSYAGLKKALGFNLAEQIVAMRDKPAKLRYSKNQQYTLSII